MRVRGDDSRVVCSRACSRVCSPTGRPAQVPSLPVLVRMLLLIRHFSVLFLLRIAAVVTVSVGWIAALVLGRLPEPVLRFLAGCLGYHVRVGTSGILLVDRYQNAVPIRRAQGKIMG
ncbi:DUF4389 domain-containing protein [Streptomyces sp. NPDC058239]|uniref:DUF4389 domain-containing protein n=1 Tax=Streptomyces sp. NPDC058239 TaxID=3346395 RepID=UPI0036F0EB42